MTGKDDEKRIEKQMNIDPRLLFLIRLLWLVHSLTLAVTRFRSSEHVLQFMVTH